MKQLVCPYCGTENEVDAAATVICSHCGQTIVVEAEATSPAADDVSNEDLPDWLDELTTEGTAPPEDQGVDALLDWLDEPESEAVEIEVPDWLEPEEALGPQSEPEDQPAPSEGEAIDEGGVSSAPEREAQSESEPQSLVPDWLDDVLDEEEAAEIFALQQAEAEGDWLSALDTANGEETPAAEDAPDWVEALTEAPGEEPPVEAVDEPFEESADVVNADVDSLPATRPLRRTPELENVPEQIAGTDLPDWLADQLQDDLEEAPEASAAEAEETGPLPDWLSEEDEAPPEAEMTVVGSAVDAEQPAATAEVQAEAEHSAEEDAEPAGSESEPRDTVEAQPERVRGLDNDEWLEMVEELAEAEEPTTGDDEPLSPTLDLGDLGSSGWMLATPRPSEEPLPTPMEAPLESSGPLAGLRGVIPIEPIIAERRIASPSETAPLSERERRLVGLLEELADQTLPVTAEESGALDGRLAAVFRLLAGLGLLALLLVGWLRPEVIPYQEDRSGPGPMVEEALAAIDRHAGQTALVAFDYTPAMAGELDAVAELMLARLEAADVAVISLSQTATGVRLAQRALEQHGAQVQDSLGLLPGEAVGLRWVSGCLTEATQCPSYFGRQVDGALQQELAQVRLVVVLTGEQGNLISWIEQVGSRADVTMVAGLTQGLAPVAIPYYANQQLAGFVGGATDAASAGAIGAAELTTSVGLAQWAAIALLAAGGVYSGLAGFRGPSRRESDS